MAKSQIRTRTSSTSFLSMLARACQHQLATLSFVMTSRPHLTKWSISPTNSASPTTTWAVPSKNHQWSGTLTDSLPWSVSALSKATNLQLFTKASSKKILPYTSSERTAYQFAHFDDSHYHYPPLDSTIRSVISCLPDDSFEKARFHISLPLKGVFKPTQILIYMFTF